MVAVLQKSVSIGSRDTPNQWEDLLRSTVDEIQAAKIRIQELEAAKRIFEAKIAAGEQFPCQPQNLTTNGHIWTVVKLQHG